MFKFPIKFRKKDDSRVGKSFYCFDPVIGYWGVPNIMRTVQSETFDSDDVDISHNEDGIRDVSFVPTDPKGSIVCIGGSHTWGGGVHREDRYSDLLGKRTGRQVVNLGHISMGMDQIALAVMEKAPKYKSDIIVIEQYPWAVVRIMNGYVNGFVKPVFSLDANGELCLAKVPWYARFSLFRRTIGAYYAYRKELNEFKSGIDLSSDYDPMADPIFLYWKTGHYDYLYRLLKKIVVEIRDYCQANDIRLVFALGAIKQQFQGDSATSLIDYDLPRMRLRAVLEQAHIPYVDMTDAMLAAHCDDDPVIFEDGHINKKGNDIFSQTLQKDLEERGWL